MNIKRKIFTTYLDFFMYIFKSKKFKNTDHLHCNTDKQPDNSVDLITIAFNNPYLIEQQIRLVKKHITDPSVTHIIADNSTDKKSREQLYTICKKAGVAYISLPRNSVTHYVRRGCYSHGAAMNWMYYNFIKLRQPKYFGFIDHDLFPTRSYSIKEHMKDLEFYGERRIYPTGWYLWAGFCFFDYEKTQLTKFNFFPCVISKGYLDTGGSNYPVLYSNRKQDSSFFCPTQSIKIGPGDDYHNDFVQQIDHAWIHAIAGGSIQHVPAKREFMDKLFEQAG